MNKAICIALTIIGVTLCTSCAQPSATHGLATSKDALRQPVLPASIGPIKKHVQRSETKNGASLFVTEYWHSKIKKQNEILVAVVTTETPDQADVLLRQELKLATTLVPLEVGEFLILSGKKRGTHDTICAWPSSPGRSVIVEAMGLSSIPTNLLSEVLKVFPSELTQTNVDRFQQPPERDK